MTIQATVLAGTLMAVVHAGTVLLAGCRSNSSHEGGEQPRTERTSETVRDRPGDASAGYVVLQTWEGGPGGMERKGEVTYIAADGFAQVTVETTEDRVVSFRAGRVNPETLFKALAETTLPPLASGDEADGVVVDYTAAHINLLYQCAGAGPRWWADESAEPPAAIARLVAEIQKALRPARLEPVVGRRFIRATRLSASTTAEYREAGLFHDLGPAQLAAMPLVRKAVESAMRLLCVPPGTNPYAGIGKDFRHGESVEVSTEHGAFQIRNLVGGQPPSQNQEVRP